VTQWPSKRDFARRQDPGNFARDPHVKPRSAHHPDTGGQTRGPLPRFQSTPGPTVLTTEVSPRHRRLTCLARHARLRSGSDRSGPRRQSHVREIGALRDSRRGERDVRAGREGGLLAVAATAPPAYQCCLAALRTRGVEPLVLVRSEHHVARQVDYRNVWRSSTVGVADELSAPIAQSRKGSSKVRGLLLGEKGAVTARWATRSP